MEYRLLIWGTGQRAKQFINNGYSGTVIGYIQTVIEEDSFESLPVYSPDNIPNNYEYIIVANIHSGEIYEKCIRVGISLDKVIFLYPFMEAKGVRDQLLIKSILKDKNYTCLSASYGYTENSFVVDDIVKYEKLNRRDSFKINRENLWMVLEDKYAYAGTVNNYFWQDLWAAKKIIKTCPDNHYDIGSRLDGFIAHLLASGIDVTMIDIREFPVKIEGLNTFVEDATYLGRFSDNSIMSLSAMCSLEHFGLGRYGDEIDPEACFKCFSNIQAKMATGGNLYISVPVGREHLEFNAHRVFYASTIVNSFAQMELIEYSCASNGKLEKDVDLHKYDEDTHNGDYRYGLFHFVKK